MAFQLVTNFDLNSPIPIDTRMVVSNITERNNLTPYNGLIVYVTNENKYYYYNGVSWIDFNITGGGATGATGPTGPPGDPGGATGATGPTGPPGVGMSNFTYVNSATTVTKNTKIGVDTSVNSFTITLPTSNLNVGDVIEIIDLNKTFDLNPLIIAGSPTVIEGSSAGLTCNIQGAHFNLIWVGGPTGWELSIIDNNFSKAGILQDPNKFEPLIFLRINVPPGVEPISLGLFNSLNAQNYKIVWTDIEWYNSELVSISETIDNSKLLTYNPTNKNIYVKEPGLYNVDMRYASYDLLDPNAFLRIRLRSSSSPIVGGLSQGSSIPDGTPGVNVLSAFAQGPIGTSFNGEAMVAGVSNFRLTSSQVPIYLAADFLHTLGPVDGAFSVFDDEFGVRPFLLMSRVSTL